MKLFFCILTSCQKCQICIIVIVFPKSRFVHFLELFAQLVIITVATEYISNILNTEKISIIKIHKIFEISAQFLAFNLTESVPSIHTGPQAFKDMINPTKKSDDQKTADHYQLEMLRRVRMNSDWSVLRLNLIG